MKRILMLLLFTSLAWVGKAIDDDVLYVNEVNIPKGGTATLEVGCSFSTEFTAFELELSLPDGFSLLMDEDGKPIVEKSFGSDHSMSGSLLMNGNYKITCYSMTKEALPMSGIIFRVTIMANQNTEIGETLMGAIVSTEFTCLSDSEGNVLDDVSFTINIVESRVLLDEFSTVMPETCYNENVRVKRTIKSNEWSTICLPFTMTEQQVKVAFGDDVQLADFAGYETEENSDGDITGINVKFTTVSLDMGMVANHPYLIKVSQDVSEFTVDGVDVEPDEEPIVATVKRTRKMWSELIGTYVANTLVPNQTLFLYNNQFWYSTGNTKMKAFRAYFDFYDVLSDVETAAASVSFFLEETTGLKPIVVSEDREEKVYDLQGHKLPYAHSLKKGIYIINGKKEVR